LKIKSPNPVNVAQEFYEIMVKKPLVKEDQDEQTNNLNSPTTSSEDNAATLSQENSVTPLTRTQRIKERSDLPVEDDNPQRLLEFYHVILFCYLCGVGNIEPIVYTIPNSLDITEWQGNMNLIGHDSINPF
jgi:hypothetical protein